MSNFYKIDKEALLQLIEAAQNGLIKEVYDIEVNEDGYCEVSTDNGYYMITEK